MLLIQLLHNLNPHGIGGPNDGLANGLQGHVLAIRVRLFHLGNLVDMLESYGRGDLVARSAAAGLDPGCLLDVPGDRGGLHDELEGVVLKSGDGNGHGCVGLVLLCAGIKVLAEGHQVQPVLSQSRSHRWCWASSSGWDRETDRRGHGPPGKDLFQRRHALNVFVRACERERDPGEIYDLELG